MESDHDNMNIRVASFACYLDATKENLVHRVSAQDPLNSSPNSMKPPLTIKFSKSKDNNHHHQTQEQHDLTNLRVDSFSNYLNSGPIQDPTSAFTFTHEIPKDGEISVFGADKYFNMKLEHQTRHEKILKQKYLETEGPNVNILPKVVTPKATTPSLCSEASSNTQAALFTNNIQKINVGSSQNHQKIPKKSIFTGFGCRGRPCFDKKSVHIHEIVPCRTGSERIIKDIIPAVVNPSIDASRPSIEVFGSSNTTSKAGDHNHSIVAANMERKLSILTWDAIPKGQKNNINPQSSPTVASSTNICDDMASEASSDLFEIENISGSIFPLLSSEPGDDMSTCMSPTSNYAPSEASIQWSVVTASAAPDYSSVVSDYNDETSVSVAGDIVMMRNKCNNNVKAGAKRGEKGQQKGRTGGLLGCKSHKAVDVAETYKQFGKSSQASRGKVKDLEMLQYPSIH